MATEFDNVRGLAAWRAKLDELLAAAKATAPKDDIQACRAVAERLTQFRINVPPALASDPASAEYAEMDRIAGQCHDALLGNAIKQRVDAITSRTAELTALRKKFESQTTANQQSAASIGWNGSAGCSRAPPPPRPPWATSRRSSIRPSPAVRPRLSSSLSPPRLRG